MGRLLSGLVYAAGRYFRISLGDTEICQRAAKAQNKQLENEWPGEIRRNFLVERKEAGGIGRRGVRHGNEVVGG